MMILLVILPLLFGGNIYAKTNHYEATFIVPSQCESYTKHWLNNNLKKNNFTFELIKASITIEALDNISGVGKISSIHYDQIELEHFVSDLMTNCYPTQKESIDFPTPDKWSDIGAFFATLKYDKKTIQRIKLGDKLVVYLMND